MGKDKKSNLKNKVKEAANKISEKMKKEEPKSEIKKEITPEEEIENLKKQITELKNDNLRTIADFDNFRKRKELELIESRDRSIINFVLDLLPAIDNFEMSLKMTDNKDMFIKGVEMIHQNLIDVLKEHKIEGFIPNIGDEFNPHSHDPILIENEEAEPGKVISLVKKGYLHRDKIIRPAKVNVKKEEVKEKK